MKAIRIWLWVVLVFLGALVAVGGITRLTGSGLSITEWKPIMGVIPPLNEAQWTEAFEKYQQIPQYQVVNPDMDLDGFKWIYFWEYFHRFLARAIGVVFAIPLIFFWITGRLERRWRLPFLGIFALGGLQGVLGWYMVRSGLSELTYVSHFRLAAHLLLAFFIGSAVVWAMKSLGEPRARQSDSGLRRFAWIVSVVIVFQTIYGAFTAGLKAGYQYPTFPTFHGEWLPAAVWDTGMGLMNFLSNPTTVQWIHRWTGTVLLIALMTVWIRSKKRLRVRSQRVALTGLAHLCGVQYVVGVGVVLWGVPVWLGTVHQVFGYGIFLLMTNFLFEFTRRENA